MSAPFVSTLETAQRLADMLDAIQTLDEHPTLGPHQHEEFIAALFGQWRVLAAELARLVLDSSA